MPNLEIHGVDEKRAGSLTERIGALLQGASYEDEVVITEVPSRVTNLKGQPQPFLRIVTTEDSQDNVADITERLRDLNLDIEVAASLKQYIPKR